MSLFSKLGGELVDIVQWTEDRPDILSHRFQRYNNEIKNGAKLTVREGQLAVMVNEGQLGKDQVADVFKPGMYELNTHNLPILSTIKGWKFGFDSPFRAEIYFFNTRKFTDLKWGTAGPAIMRDAEFGAVRVTAFGIYSIRVTDAKTFLVDLVGTQEDFTTEDIEANLRGKVGIRVKEVMPEIGVPVIDLSGQGGRRRRQDPGAHCARFREARTRIVRSAGAEHRSARGGRARDRSAGCHARDRQHAEFQPVSGRAGTARCGQKRG